MGSPSHGLIIFFMLASAIAQISSSSDFRRSNTALLPGPSQDAVSAETGIFEDSIVVSRRSLKQIQPSGNEPMTYINGSLVLAAERTTRPNLLDNFNNYHDGWNIRNINYWASVGFTAAPGFVLGAAWLAFGLALVLFLCCYSCCSSDEAREKRAGGGALFPFLLLIFFTSAAVGGCVLVYIGQGEFHHELSEGLAYVVNQSEMVVFTLRNVTYALLQTQSIGVLNYGLSDADKTRIQELNSQLTSAADTLEIETKDNANTIKNVLEKVRKYMIIVAAVMLALVLLGFFISLIGASLFVYTLASMGWFLVVITWILCGVYVLLNNVMGDTCIAMQEWVSNPSARTALDEILPCVDASMADRTLDQTKKLTNSTTNGINAAIISTVNGNNIVAAGIPELCNPVQPILSSPHCVDFLAAPQAWKSHVCTTTDNAACLTQGKIPYGLYSQLNTSVEVVHSLYTYMPFLVKLQDCEFVRDVFTSIVENHCKGLRKYSKWEYTGLSLISGGVSGSILLWLLYFGNCHRRRRYRQNQQGVLKSNRSNRRGVAPQNGIAYRI